MSTRLEFSADITLVIWNSLASRTAAGPWGVTTCGSWPKSTRCLSRSNPRGKSKAHREGIPLGHAAEISEPPLRGRGSDSVKTIRDPTSFTNRKLRSSRHADPFESSITFLLPLCHGPLEDLLGLGCR
jgi:hypothetical protein